MDALDWSGVLTTSLGGRRCISYRPGDDAEVNEDVGQHLLLRLCGHGRDRWGLLKSQGRGRGHR